MSDVSYYTPEGLKKLKDELLQLEQVERPRVTQEIADARDKGDLSENAEYHAAKEEQSLLETKIAKLKNVVAKARIIDESQLDVSKIGSLPELKKLDVVAVTKNAFDYLESRSSKQISFSFQTTEKEIFSNLNEELYGWVIENLIKNAIDAMQGKGSLNLTIESTASNIKVQVSDSGKGMAKSQFKKIFKPGFTTKKRGWGLGLSLSKRIVEDYHNGKIFVKNSEINKGTTFQLVLNKVS